MATGQPSCSRTGPRGLTPRDFYPLIGFVAPTLITGYGIVMPRNGILGINELTVGFASAVLGACVTYAMGLRAAIRRRAASGAAQPHAWRRPTFIARQSARPRGVVGWMVAHIMRAETATANDMTIQFLGLRGSERVLDVGCGAGHAVSRVAARLVTGRVVGLDPSPTMVRAATRHNRRLIARRKAVIDQGDANRLPYPAASFDRILSTHTVYFWPDLAPVARELRRVLTPDGLLVLGFGDPERMRTMFPESVYTLRSAAEIERVFVAAGFAETRIETREISGHTMSWLLAGSRVPS